MRLHGSRQRKALSVAISACSMAKPASPSLTPTSLPASMRWRTSGQDLMQMLARDDTTGKWQNLLKDAEAYCGVKDGVWTKEADEKFAVSFERYMYDGVAPTSKLKTVFEKVRGWIAKLLDRVKTLEGYDLSPEIINVYNVMLGGEYVETAPAPKQESGQMNW